MELVTEPDIETGLEARRFAEELQLILRYLEVSYADMEKGQMRIEVNISLMKEESKEFGTKAEIKNLNSFKSVERSIDYEISRQKEILESGGKVIQETRGWNDAKEETFSQREKEQAHDYRYFPEPDLPVLRLGTPEHIREVRAELPELPQQKRERLVREYDIDSQTVEIFVQKKSLGEYFEKVVSEFDPGLPKERLQDLIKIATNYLTTDLQGLLKGLSVEDRSFLIDSENFAEFITLIEQGKISSKIAKIILGEMYKTGADPSHIIEEKGLIQINDEAELKNIIEGIIAKNPQAVEDFKKGKSNSFQFLIGQIMTVTKGKANPQAINKLLGGALTKKI